MNGPELLAKYLSDTGTTQAALAAVVGCSAGAVSLWLDGGRSPGGKSAFAIEEATKGVVPASAWFEKVEKKARHARKVARRAQ